MSNRPLAKHYRQAKAEGRLCEKCGWIVTVKNWKKGYRICAGCWSASKGVNVSGGYGQALDEPRDMTGDMP